MSESARQVKMEINDKDESLSLSRSFKDQMTTHPHICISCLWSFLIQSPIRKLGFIRNEKESDSILGILRDWFWFPVHDIFDKTSHVRYKCKWRPVLSVGSD